MQRHTTSIRPIFGPGGARTPDYEISLFELIILLLTAYWFLSLFGQSMIPNVTHTGGFIDVLSIAIVVLIIMKFLS